MPPTSIDGTDITGATIDGTDVQEITVDGDTVFSATPPVPFQNDLIVRYDFSQENGNTPVSDLSGNGLDLINGSYSGVSRSINGVQAGEFDGSNDRLDTGSFTIRSQPWTFAMVFDMDLSTTRDQALFTYVDPPDFAVFEWDNPFRWNGGGAVDGSTNQSVQLIAGTANTTNTNIREEGTQTGTGSIGNRGVDFIALGVQARNNIDYYDGLIGEFLIYDGALSTSQFQQVETYLSNKWSIVI